MRRLRVLALFLTITMLVSLLAACGGKTNNTSPPSNNSAQQPKDVSKDKEPELKKDTITALLPPVSANYQARFPEMEKEFNELYPHHTFLGA